MIHNPNMYRVMPIGIVLRKAPGVTRWVPWNWTVAAALPGVADADWRELRREGEAVEYLAGTLMLELHGAETEAYRTALMDEVPSVYVVVRENDTEEPHPLDLFLITASPYEAQDYSDNGEDLVAKVPMPAQLVAWVKDFIDTYHEEEVFVKRRRDKQRVDLVQDGIGDPRVGKAADIYASPTLKRTRLQ